jgi:16S rRNA (cytosine1402-N4)-methyltransferase
MHQPVLIRETLKLLFSTPNGVYFDGTGGSGGHAWELVNRLKLPGRLLILDLDPLALDNLKSRFSSFANVDIIQENFSNLKTVLTHLKIEKLCGAILDLGLSSLLLEQPRGFSYRLDSPLDMRFNPQIAGKTAQELLNTASEAELAHILRSYGEVSNADKIAKAIKQKSPQSTSELARIVARFAYPHLKEKILSQVFQAVRIAVNSELDNLRKFLQDIPAVMEPGGRLTIISYHSLEDRIVKEFFRRESRNCICPPGFPKCLCGHQASFKILTSHAVKPSPMEIKSNPRARSARLRAGERL